MRAAPSSLLVAGLVLAWGCAPVGSLTPLSGGGPGPSLLASPRVAPSAGASGSVSPLAEGGIGLQVDPADLLRTETTVGTLYEGDNISFKLVQQRDALQVGQKARWEVSLVVAGSRQDQALWSSSNEAVAKVNSLGEVEAVGEGKATIVAHYPPNPSIRVGAELVVRPNTSEANLPTVGGEAPRGTRWVEGRLVALGSGEGIAKFPLHLKGVLLQHTDATGRFRVALKPGEHLLEGSLAPRFVGEGHVLALKVKVSDVTEPLDLGSVELKAKRWQQVLNLGSDQGSTWRLQGEEGLWVGTRSGLAHRSVDGGSTWSSLDLGFKAPLQAIHTEGEKLVWVLAADGALQRSRDGGQSWQSIRPADGLAALDVASEGELKAWLLSRGGLQFTEDGGQSWRQLHSDKLPPDARFFNLGRDGLVIHDADYVLHSRDGGLTWPHRPSGNGPAFLEPRSGELVARDRNFGKYLVFMPEDGSFTRLGYDGPLAGALVHQAGGWQGIVDAHDEASVKVLGMPRFTSPTRGWRLLPEGLERY